MQKSYDELRNYAKSCLSDKRFRHSELVAETAAALAETYGADARRAAAAGILHDITKEKRGDKQIELCRKLGLSLPEELYTMPQVLHGFSAARLLSEKGIVTDESVLDAIRYHTTGRAGMSALEKVVYIADCIEPSRDFEDVEKIRNAASVSLDLAMVTALKSITENLIKRGEPVCSLSAQALSELEIKNER